MAATYLNSCSVSKLLGRALIILSCGALYTRPANTETLTGVVYFKELGNGAHPVGTFEIAAGKSVRTIEFAEDLENRFSDETCHDIGAVWSVEISYLADSPYAKRVICTGRVDDDVHAPYLLVRDYLERLASTGVLTSGLSSRYRSSKEFQSFARLLNPPDLKFLFGWNHIDMCVKAVSTENSTRTRLATHCGIQLRDGLLVLVFDVVRSEASGEWEIDRIDIE